MCRFDTYDIIVYIFYDRRTNTFYDQCGINIVDIQDMITPNDLFLFRKDKHRRYFTHRYNDRALCKISEGDDYESEIDFKPCDIQMRNMCLAFSEYNSFENEYCSHCVEYQKIERMLNYE